jgi:hypothetical protein
MANRLKKERTTLADMVTGKSGPLHCDSVLRDILWYVWTDDNLFNPIFCVEGPPLGVEITERFKGVALILSFHMPAEYPLKEPKIDALPWTSRSPPAGAVVRNWAPAVRRSSSDMLSPPLAASSVTDVARSSGEAVATEQKRSRGPWVIHVLTAVVFRFTATSHVVSEDTVLSPFFCGPSLVLFRTGKTIFSSQSQR